MELMKKILIADTGEEFRRSFLDGLDSEVDIQVVGETGDGEELLRMVREKRPDLVVMEIVLSKMDGIEVLEELGRMDPDMRPKTLILSGFARGTMAQLAADKGADHYMTKPCRISTVCERIRQLVGNGQMDERESVRSLETMVTAIIHDVGVPAHI